MGRHQTDAAQQAARGSSGERPSYPQWHLLGFAIRSTLARSTALLKVLRTPRKIAAWGQLVGANLAKFPNNFLEEVRLRRALNGVAKAELGHPLFLRAQKT